MRQCTQTVCFHETLIHYNIKARYRVYLAFMLLYFYVINSLTLLKKSYCKLPKILVKLSSIRSRYVLSSSLLSMV